MQCKPEKRVNVENDIPTDTWVPFCTGLPHFNLEDPFAVVHSLPPFLSPICPPFLAPLLPSSLPPFPFTLGIMGSLSV